MPEKYCGHYTSNYLPLTANWIYRSVINHIDYQPVFICRTKQNIAHFPLKRLYSLQDLPRIQRLWQILYFRLVGYLPFFKRICRQNNVSIFHAHFGYQGAKSTGLAKALRVPLICSFYGDDAFASIHENKYKTLFRVADRILVLGPYMRSRLIALGCPADKLVIHHLGIDVDEIKLVPRKVETERPVRFLIASSFLKKKGIELAIKALGNLRDRFDFTLDVIGDGPLKSRILDEITSSGIESRVMLHGYKPYADVIALAGKCDVFIQASRTTEDNRKEGTPMVIVDMMATGMAVISTDHSDIPEIVQDGKNGFLAKENDVQSLQECIQKVFDDRARIEKLGLTAREWVEREFNVKLQTGKLEKIYTDVIQSYRKS